MLDWIHLARQMTRIRLS